MRWALLCCSLLLLAGCVSMLPRGFVEPEVSLVDVRFKDARLLETTIICTVRISNENNEAIALDGAVHKVYLGGLYVGKGLSNQRVEIPRLATAVYDLEVNVSNVRLLTRLQQLLNADRLEYKVNSVLHLEQPRSARVSSVSSGSLDLAAAREAAGMNRRFAPPPLPAD